MIITNKNKTPRWTRMNDSNQTFLCVYLQRFYNPDKLPSTRFPFRCIQNLPSPASIQKPNAISQPFCTLNAWVRPEARNPSPLTSHPILREEIGPGYRIKPRHRASFRRVLFIGHGAHAPTFSNQNVCSVWHGSEPLRSSRTPHSTRWECVRCTRDLLPLRLLSVVCKCPEYL